MINQITIIKLNRENLPIGNHYPYLQRNNNNNILNLGEINLLLLNIIKYNANSHRFPIQDNDKFTLYTL